MVLVDWTSMRSSLPPCQNGLWTLSKVGTRNEKRLWSHFVVWVELVAIYHVTPFFQRIR